jgi:signal transduction histidine kinase
MFETSTLRGRLALAYTAALTIALCLFALAMLGTIDRIQRHSLDSELLAVAATNVSTIEITGDRKMEDADRARFISRAGQRVASAAIAPDRRIIVSSAVAVPSAVTIREDGERLRVALAPIGSGRNPLAVIAVWSDLEEVAAVDRYVAVAFAIGIPVFAELALFGGRAIARRGLEQLERMAGEAAQIDGRDLTARISTAQPAELNRLAETLNSMLERLRAAFERERRFAADASHVLRAPLAIVAAEADLALASERTPAEYRRALEAIALEADGIETLTGTLLATARAETADAAPATLDLAEVVESVRDRSSALAESRGLTLRAYVEDGAIVRADADDVERAILTIVHNAIAYTGRRDDPARRTR